jgi:polyvinyl alcohol dehydrogenase (cytochrome)
MGCRVRVPQRGFRGGLVAGLVFVLSAVGCSGTDSAAVTATTSSVSAEPVASTVSPTPSTSPTTTLAPQCPSTERPPVAESDWPTYGFDDANSRHNRAETRIGPDNVSCLEVLWRIDGLGGVTGTPVVVDAIAYFGDWAGALHAVDAATGAVVWEEQLTKHAITATALVTDRHVFVPDVDGFLHARDRATGSAVWTVEVDDQPSAAIVSAPVLVDGMLIMGVAGNSPFASMRGSVVAVDADTGVEMWRVNITDENSGAGGGVWTAGAVDRELGLVFFGTGNTMQGPVSPLADALVAIDYATGALAWHNVLNPDDLNNVDIGASPNLFTIDGRAVVGVGDKNGLFKVVDRETGDDVWSVKLTSGADGHGVFATAAVGDGVIYVNSMPVETPGSITFALDSSDGSILWERPIPGGTYGSLTVANGVVFHGTVGGTIYALDAGDGTVLWSEKMPGGFGDGISVANGRLFIGYGFSPGYTPVRDGGIVAYSLP